MNQRRSPAQAGKSSKAHPPRKTRSWAGKRKPRPQLAEATALFGAITAAALMIGAILDLASRLHLVGR